MENNWIDREFKSYYLDSNIRGLRITFSKKIDLELKEEVLKICKWLRKNYWFPIRVDVVIKNSLYFIDDLNDNKGASALFYYPKNENETPLIWVSIGKYQNALKKRNKENAFCQILFLICHELTHYFQWYFLENEKRTKRSLEIEANYYADMITQKYFDLFYRNKIENKR